MSFSKNQDLVPRLRRKARELARDTQASVLPIMAAALVPTMAMIGGGIDFGRAYLAQSKLQGAVDAGALAAVRAKQITSNTKADAENIGKDYIAANFPVGYAGSTLGVEKVTVIETNSDVSAEVTASGTISTTLLRIIGIDSLPFQARATAKASDRLPKNVEAVLVLDNTGSMSGQKMRDLKIAAKDFVTTVYRDENSREGIAVGIVPYNVNVNVGHLVRDIDSSKVAEYPHYTNISRTDPLAWKGCVFADPTIQALSSDPYVQDTGAYDITKLLPGEEGMPKIEPYIYPPIQVDSFDLRDNQYKIPYDRRRILEIPTVKEALVWRFGDDICTTRDGDSDRKCSDENSRIAIERLPESEQDKYKDARIYATSSERTKATGTRNLNGPSPNYVCPAEALPVSYSNTRDQLKSYIDLDNAALPNIGTFHTPALVWGYRLLERNDFFTRERPDDKPINKVLIFMTDGIFDSRDDGRIPIGGGSRRYDTSYTAYKTYEHRLMTNSATKNANISALQLRFSKVCEAAKNDGIQIYMIAFDVNSNSTKEMFRNCATDRNTHFFDTANGKELNAAFVTIASELVNLRLVK
jgi:Flp pilus assembly protein TadG